MSKKIQHTDLMELLNALEYQTIELAAIREAAKDYVTLKEVVIPMYKTTPEAIKHRNETDLAYDNLKELVS